MPESCCSFLDFDVIEKDGRKIPVPISEPCPLPAVKDVVIRGAHSLLHIHLCAKHQDLEWLMRAAIEQKEIPDA